MGANHRHDRTETRHCKSCLDSPRLIDTFADALEMHSGTFDCSNCNPHGASTQHATSQHVPKFTETTVSSQSTGSTPTKSRCSPSTCRMRTPPHRDRYLWPLGELTGRLAGPDNFCGNLDMTGKTDRVCPLSQYQFLTPITLLGTIDQRQCKSMALSRDIHSTVT